MPCEKIDESPTEIAFLDIMPCAPGHTLVLPKREVERFEDLPEEDAASLIRFLQRISIAISRCFNRTDYNVILNNGRNAGQEVMHMHFHIIPRTERTSRLFSNRKSSNSQELKEIGDRIRACLP